MGLHPQKYLYTLAMFGNFWIKSVMTTMLKSWSNLKSIGVKRSVSITWMWFILRLIRNNRVYIHHSTHTHPFKVAHIRHIHAHGIDLFWLLIIVCYRWGPHLVGLFWNLWESTIPSLVSLTTSQKVLMLHWRDYRAGEKYHLTPLYWPCIIFKVFSTMKFREGLLVS